MMLRIVVILACSFSFLSCKKEAAAVPDPEVKVVEVDSSDSVIVPKPEQFPLVEVQLRASSSETHVTGVVAPDVSRTVPVNALLSGRVTAIRARLGDTVKKGQVLLDVASPDLAIAFSDYQKFQADAALAKKQLERAKLLFDHGALAAKEVEVAQSTYDKSLVDVKATSDRIRLQGANVDAMSNTFEIRAPVSGTITAQNTAVSANVKTPDNAPDLFTISDLSRVWVLCDVYENLLANVRLGDNASVVLNAYPDRTMQGRVSNISQVLDPATRTAKVRLELDNSHGLLKPGMFATVTFFSQNRRNRETVPSTAVIRLHDKSWVYKADGQGRFKRVEVQAGAALEGGQQEILGGLEPGDKVVKNALALSSAGDQS